MVSATMSGCMESGKDVMWGGAMFNSTGNSCIGVGNVADSLNVITVEKPHSFECLYAEQGSGVIQQRPGFVVQPRLFFNINPINHFKPLSLP